MFTSRKIKTRSDSEALLFVHLILEADDDGRGEGDPETIHMKAKNRRWSEVKIEKMMASLSTSELVDWYTNNGGQYYEVVAFLDHQQGSWHGKSAKPSKYPAPHDSGSSLHHNRLTGQPTVVDGSTKSAQRSEVKGREEKGREEKEKKDAHPREPRGNVENPECAQVHEPDPEPEDSTPFIRDPRLSEAAKRIVQANGLDPSMIADAQDETAQERRRT
jgi:hypothetical protein